MTSTPGPQGHDEHAPPTSPYAPPSTPSSERGDTTEPGPGTDQARDPGSAGYAPPAYGSGPYGQPRDAYAPPSASPAYDATPGYGSSYGSSAYGGAPQGAPSPTTPGYAGYGAGGAGYGAAGYGATSPYGSTPGYASTWSSPGGAPPAAAKRGGTGRTVLIAAAVALVVGGGVGAGVAAAVSDGSQASSAGLSQSTQAAPAAKLDGSVAAAASAISPSVVTLSVASGQSGGTGSGIVIKTDGDTGYILTNNHVVTLDSQSQASANQISVILPSGKTVDATVVGTDTADDLAVVKVQGSGLKAAMFASSSKLQVGQTVVAMGAPLGLSNTVTSGIVSALARPVATGTGNDGAIFNAVQTDAAINPGNSGGPLVDLNGHVVGVNSAIAGTGDQSSSGAQSGNIGIGFAIPSDEAERIAGELISTGKATHAVLGITVNGQQQQSGPTSGAGAKVGTVQSGSPAEKAGIKAGDIITKIGDQRIDDSIGAIAATRSFAPGTTVPVTVSSGGADRTVQVTLGSATDS